MCIRCGWNLPRIRGLLITLVNALASIECSLEVREVRTSDRREWVLIACLLTVLVWSFEERQPLQTAWPWVICAFSKYEMYKSRAQIELNLFSNSSLALGSVMHTCIRVLVPPALSVRVRAWFFPQCLTNKCKFNNAGHSDKHFLNWRKCCL